MTIAWLGILLYGAGCASFGWLAGHHDWSPVAAVRTWLYRRKHPRKACTLTEMDAMLRNAYPLEYRDQLLSRIGKPLDFGKLTKAPPRAGTTWVEPVMFPKDKETP